MRTTTVKRPSGYAKHPGYRISFEPCRKRIRAVVDGETIVDTIAARLMHESKHLPVYYFPRADVRMDLLRATEHASHCPFKGDASYWTIATGVETRENAVWSYEDPYDEVSGIKDYLACYWNRVDHWYEEDEEVFVHARDPYSRIDILDSARPVRVIVGGACVAESSHARFLFETGLPVRYYLPLEDVSDDILVAAEKQTACPYKGTASYYSVKLGGELYEDLVWTYPEPIAEAARIKDRLCFFNERVDRIEIDGVAEEKPKTQWS